MTNYVCIVSLPLFIVSQVFFPLWIHHHTSVNDNRSDGDLFFTLYLNKVLNMKIHRQFYSNCLKKLIATLILYTLRSNWHTRSSHIFYIGQKFRLIQFFIVSPKQKLDTVVV